MTDFLLDGLTDLAWHHLDILHHNLLAFLFRHTSAVLSILDHCLILLQRLAHLVFASRPEVDGFPTGDAFFVAIVVDGAVGARALQFSSRHLFAGGHNCALLHKPLLTFQLFHIPFNKIL